MDRSSDAGPTRGQVQNHEHTGALLKTTPCPKCGKPFVTRAESGGSAVCPTCHAVLHLKSVVAEVKTKGHLLRRARHPGRGKYDTQRVEGDSFYRATGRWHRMTWIIDRPRNRYYKHIVDTETGKTIRHEDCPLSEHRGGVPRSKPKKHTGRAHKEEQD